MATRRREEITPKSEVVNHEIHKTHEIGSAKNTPKSDV
jgi:hypothetical protein